MNAATGPLTRRLGTADAVVVGLCAMIGAGVFAVFAPAAQAAGAGLLLASASRPRSPSATPPRRPSWR